MKQVFTLASLESLLEDLPRGRRVTLATKHVHSLFGFNDVAARRIARFAKGHHCIITHANDCVVLEKRPPDPNP